MKVYDISRDDHGKTYQIKVGDVLAIRLPENPTTGYRWITVSLDSSIFEAESSAYLTTGTGIGGSGLRELRLRPTAAGKTAVKLLLARPWERNKIGGTKFQIEVVVN